MGKRKFTVEEYLQIFDLYEAGYSFETIIEMKKLDISNPTLYHNYNRYIKHGIESLMPQKTNERYTSEFKKQLIDEHLVNGKTPKMIAVEYNMPSHTTVRRWIIKYTEGKENKNYSPKPEVYNMKSRKTTLEERIEIVNYCLNNELSYKDTAERFNVSYSQVYNWIRKYREYGEPGLYDGRGKGKPAEILSTEEELKLKVKALETRNKFLEMENETLKKKKQIERQLMNRKSDR